MEISPSYRKILSGEARGIGPAIMRLALRMLSIAYGLAVRVRNLVYDLGLRAERRVQRPVVSVGNITAGGTGKTPAVEYVAKWFAERGARPAVISRGYRSKDGRNDEALLLSSRLPGIPHRQSPDRFRAALEAIRLDKATVLVLDDGFQHRRLGRFGDVVLVDATCPFGYGFLLPRGLLREPAKALARADVIVVTRCDLVDASALSSLEDKLERLAPGVPRALARHVPTGVSAYPDGACESPSQLRGKRVGIFCSIGNPPAFRMTVENLGASVAWFGEFPDHHWYTPADVAEILRADNRQVDEFVTTEKDAVKLDGLWPRGRRLWVLRVEMCIHAGEGTLTALLEEALHAATYGEEKGTQE